MAGNSEQHEVGHYLKLEKLGQGAFGTVWKGWSLKTQKERALKELVLSDDNDIDIAKRELEPILALDRAEDRHRNIVQVSSHFVDKGSLWLVMEYLPLGTMNDFLLQRRNSPHTLRFMRQIADAVAFLHDHEIVHRDLKPDNILVAGTRTHPNVKVADFGLAKVCENTFDDIYSQYYLQTGMAFVWYGAPEIRDGHYTEKCDVYSMGAMFAAMLDRTTIRDGKRLLAVHIHRQPLAMVQRDCPGIDLEDYIMTGQPDSDLKQLILLMMDEDYHDRPPASEVWQFLRRC
ncbi:serine/threonine-protein kinase pdik1l-A-like isoform X2 [Branchiostoma floridae x Branchiostoma belcheri]